jgi:hypothetical protein
LASIPHIDAEVTVGFAGFDLDIAGLISVSVSVNDDVGHRLAYAQGHRRDRVLVGVVLGGKLPDEAACGGWCVKSGGERPACGRHLSCIPTSRAQTTAPSRRRRDIVRTGREELGRGRKVLRTVDEYEPILDPRDSEDPLNGLRPPNDREIEAVLPRHRIDLEDQA